MAPNTPVATATILETATVTVDQSVFISCTTITEAYQTTIAATRGQTIILNSPSSYPTSSPPTTKVYPSYAPTVTSTTTTTELEIYLQTSRSVYSTWTVPLTSQYPPYVTPAGANTGQLVYVVAPDSCTSSGWDCWSSGAKVGLIIGVIAAALFLLWALTWCLKRRNAWIAHDWRWARNVEGPVNGSVVPTVNVQGPLDGRLAGPYGYGVGQGVGGYGQGHPGWGYMR